MLGTGAVIWSHQWSKGIDCAPLPNLPTRQIRSWIILAGLIRGDQVLGFHSQAGMKWFFPEWLFFLHFQLNPHQQEPPYAWASMQAPWQLRWQQRSGAGFCREVGRENGQQKNTFQCFSKARENQISKPLLLLESDIYDEGVVETNHCPWPIAARNEGQKEPQESGAFLGGKNLP